MGTKLIVPLPPCFDAAPRVVDATEPGRVQALLSQQAIETPYVPVLCGFPMCDEVKLHRARPGPVIERARDELRPCCRRRSSSGAVLLATVAREYRRHRGRSASCRPRTRGSHDSRDPLSSKHGNDAYRAGRPRRKPSPKRCPVCLPWAHDRGRDRSSPSWLGSEEPGSSVHLHSLR